MAALLDPARVILGGSIGRALAPYLPRIEDLSARLLTAPRRSSSHRSVRTLPSSARSPRRWHCTATRTRPHCPISAPPSARRSRPPLQSCSPQATAPSPAACHNYREARCSCAHCAAATRTSCALRWPCMRSGAVPANSYVLDLDAVTANAAVMSEAAAPLGLTVYAMTKQVGRNPHFCRAVKEGGIPAAVAVDMPCARAVGSGGLRVGHLGPSRAGGGARGGRGSSPSAGLLDGLQRGQGCSGSSGSRPGWPGAGPAAAAARAGRHVLPRTSGRVPSRGRACGGGFRRQAEWCQMRWCHHVPGAAVLAHRRHRRPHA